MQALGVGAFLFCLLSTAAGNRAATIKDSIARECGVDEDQPAQRTFADPEGKNAWRAYRKLICRESKLMDGSHNCGLPPTAKLSFKWKNQAKIGLLTQTIASARRASLSRCDSK
jgi:hypothetical protein